jgi:hypothetical protein
MLRQGDAQVFKKYSQMKLQMKREALEKINRLANEMQVLGAPALCSPLFNSPFVHSSCTVRGKNDGSD